MDEDDFDYDHEDCICWRYVVDMSDPDRYHPENIDIEENLECPIHGKTGE